MAQIYEATRTFILAVLFLGCVLHANGSSASQESKRISEDSFSVADERKNSLIYKLISETEQNEKESHGQWSAKQSDRMNQIFGGNEVSEESTDDEEMRKQPGIWGKRSESGVENGELEETNPGIWGKRENPGIWGKRANPGIWGKRENPGIWGKRENPGIWGKRANPGIWGKRENLGMLGKRTNPGIWGKRTNPGIWGKRSDKQNNKVSQWEPVMMKILQALEENRQQKIKFLMMLNLLKKFKENIMSQGGKEEARLAKKADSVASFASTNTVKNTV